MTNNEWTPQAGDNPLPDVRHDVLERGRCLSKEDYSAVRAALKEHGMDGKKDWYIVNEDGKLERVHGEETGEEDDDENWVWAFCKEHWVYFALVALILIDLAFGAASLHQTVRSLILTTLLYVLVSRVACDVFDWYARNYGKGNK